MGNPLKLLARPEGFEPPTLGFVVRCSIRTELRALVVFSGTYLKLSNFFKSLVLILVSIDPIFRQVWSFGSLHRQGFQLFLRHRVISPKGAHGLVVCCRHYTEKVVALQPSIISGRVPKVVQGEVLNPSSYAS
jgi:hypothetical protein